MPQEWPSSERSVHVNANNQRHRLEDDRLRNCLRETSALKIPTTTTKIPTEAGVRLRHSVRHTQIRIGHDAGNCPRLKGSKNFTLSFRLSSSASAISWRLLLPSP